ncbi:MAG: YceI family protein [Chloroflexi bacterium]|nr:YceI family protein [Chloroflexota bacterium]
MLFESPPEESRLSGRWFVVILFALLLATACSGQSASNSSSPPLVVSQPAGSPTGPTPTAMIAEPAPPATMTPLASPDALTSPGPLASPPAAASPAASPVASASPAASPAGASPTASPGASASPVAAQPPLSGPRYRVVAEQSEASYQAREKFVDRPLPSEAIGRTRDLAGDIQLERDGILRGLVLQMRVDLRTLTSDQPRRDNFIRQNTLQTDQFPYAEFRALGLVGPMEYQPGDDVEIQIPGTMTIKGREYPLVWDARARLDGDTLIGTATTRVKLSSVGLEPPRLAILSVEDEMTWAIQFVAARVP